MQLHLQRIGDGEGNPFGYQRVDVICFNYDGEGTALVMEDGQMATMYKDEVEHLITMVIGVDAAGNPIGTHYKVVGDPATPF